MLQSIESAFDVDTWQCAKSAMLRFSAYLSMPNLQATYWYHYSGLQCLMNTVVVSLIVKNCVSIHGFVCRDVARTTTDIVFLIDRITDTEML